MGEATSDASPDAAWAATVLRCYSGSPVVELELPDGRVIRDGSAGPDGAAGPDAAWPADLAALSGIPCRARLEPGPRLVFGTPVPEPYARCLAEDLARGPATGHPGPTAPDGPGDTVGRGGLAVPATERLGEHSWRPLPALPAASIAGEFWRCVEEFADRPAIVAEDGAELSYRAFGARVASIAALLGARPHERVGLLLDHGAGTVAAILATLTAGAAYVPLDPRYPLPRLLAMAAHARVGTVLTTAAHRPLAEGLAGEALILDVDSVPSSTAPPTGTQQPPADQTAPAYILYTSGSTGVPKGVVQTHRNALHQVRLHRTNLGITPADRLSVVSSFGFDMAVTDTFAALLTGGCCVPVDVRAFGLDGLADALRRHRVTIYHSTPTVFRYLADVVAEPLADLRAVVLGGEAVTGEDVRRCRKLAASGGILVNGYGATEISFAVQNHVPLDTPAPGAVVPIGFPLRGMRIGLLAADGSPAAVVGEIAISSDFLAGYWENPAESARFDTDHAGVRRYRTGDLARRRPDGRLEYLGRRDRQVKVRGYRVELAEIEHELRAIDGVMHAAVLAGDEQLHAFVVSTMDPADLRELLARRLPDHLVPATVTPVSKLPLTPTGKVDSGALLARLRASSEAPVDGPDGFTDLEGLIAMTWTEALGRKVGRDDRFFDVGGHSLLAAKVHHRLVERLGRRFPLTDLYANPTIASLAAHLAAPDQPRTPLTSATHRMARRRAARPKH